MLKPEEHNAILNDVVANLSDTAKVTAYLNQIRDDYKDVNAELVKASTLADTLKSENEKLDDANKKLQAYNLELFLERGTQQSTNTYQHVKPAKDENKLSFDDLDLSNF